MVYTFCGCSITVGVGLPLEKSSPKNYANIVANHYSADINNLAVGGNSNYNIFITALNEILFNTPDKIFVQWSAINRTWLYPEPELHNVFVIMSTTTADTRIDNVSGFHTSIFKDKKEIQKFIDQYLLLNGDYVNLLKLIEYSNILKKVADDSNCQLIMINGLVPWTDELLRLGIITNYNKEFSDYTKSMIKFDTRNDEDIERYLAKLEKEFNSLDKKLWVNIFSSMLKLAVDTGTDQSHPGPNSHQMYADMVIKYLEETNGKRIYT